MLLVLALCSTLSNQHLLKKHLLNDNSFQMISDQCFHMKLFEEYLNKGWKCFLIERVVICVMIFIGSAFPYKFLCKVGDKNIY